jgi:hypothetical protein
MNRVSRVCKMSKLGNMMLPHACVYAHTHDTHTG